MLTTDVRDRVATITITRAAKANSLPRQAKAELAREVRRCSSSSDIDAVVITGAGDRAFCAGSDIGEMRSFGMAEMDGMLADERAMYLAPLTSPKPVIAAVNGYALGAGLILAMSCDYIVAARHAAFGAPELTIGVAAPLEGLLLPYFVGLARARALFYTGERIQAEEALAFGLINEIAAIDELRERAIELAQAMARLPANGFAVQKWLLYSLLSTGHLEEVIRESHHLTSRQFATSEVREAMSRFMDRRHSASDADEPVDQRMRSPCWGASPSGSVPRTESGWARRSDTSPTELPPWLARGPGRQSARTPARANELRSRSRAWRHATSRSCRRQRSCARGVSRHWSWSPRASSGSTRPTAS